MIAPSSPGTSIAVVKIGGSVLTGRLPIVVRSLTGELKATIAADPTRNDQKEHRSV